MEYQELPENIRVTLEDEVKMDPYGLSPKTLYRNIVGTLGTSTVEETALIFGVSILLVKKIEDLNF